MIQTNVFTQYDEYMTKLPEIAAGVDDPLADSFLSKLFFQQRVLVAEQFHGEFVVGRLEQSDQLIAEVVGKIRRFGYCCRTKLFLRRSIQTYVITCSLTIETILL